jgi:uncharacterized protein
MMANGLALHWRLIQQRYNLVGTTCKNCGQNFFPPRVICPDCRRKSDIEKIKYSGGGQVLSHTVIHAAPTGFEYMKPYVVGIIRLDEGPLVTAQIVDCNPGDVEVGRRVEKVFRKIIADNDSGIIRYGYKFKLTD